MHDCPEAQGVWEAVAAAWEAVTRETIDVSTPRLTVMGLRQEPGGAASRQEPRRHAATEPAWRLLHAVTVLKIHQARTRVHMAHHAEAGQHDPKSSPETSGPLKHVGSCAHH